MPRLLLIFALVALPRLLLAEPAPAPIYVTVRLAPECQGASDFAQQLLSRTHRLRWANPGEPGIVFDVAAGPLQGAFIGQLQIRELDGRYTQRSVEGKTCDGVVNALAFVAAVLADPKSCAKHEAHPGGVTTSEPARRECTERVHSGYWRHYRRHDCNLECATSTKRGPSSRVGVGTSRFFTLDYSGPRSAVRLDDAINVQRRSVD